MPLRHMQYGECARKWADYKLYFVIGFVLRFKSFKKSFFVELPYLTSFPTELVQPHLVQGDYVQKVQNL